ncbi:MAG: enoyl-CoA hydratase [Chloroflexi bacterium]|nr:enoyl-CoA hydratase [Chloroflexota bacterium]
MTYKAILFHVEEGVATITLNRPEALNALDDQMGEELEEVTRRCRADAGVRAVILKGAGRAFCSGADLREVFGQLVQGEARAGLRMLEGLHAAITEIQRMEKPVIAQVHGPAVGAGMGLALACDLTIAAQTARFIIGYDKVGLSPDGSMTYFLPRLVGPKRALEIFYTGEVIDADQAKRMGLVNRVAPDVELEKETRALAQQVAQGPTLAFGRAKELVYHGLNESLETQLEKERECLGLSAASEDFREGVRALIDKREPQFVGR